MPVNEGEIIRAIEEAKEKGGERGFNQSIELIMALRDIDVKNPENRINEIIELPYPPSKKVRIGVFATGGLALRAREAGADVVYGKEDLEGLSDNRKEARNLAKDIDFFIAETSLMPLLARVLGSILGPRGGMPTPVPPTASIDELIDRRRSSVKLRVRGQLSAQCRVGSEDMDSGEVAENIRAVLRRMERRLERGLRNIREAYVKTTMGPPTKIS